MRLTLRNCSFNQSYENTIQSFFELCIFTSFCIWYPILFLRLLSDEQTKRGGFQYEIQASDFLEAEGSSSFENY